jgi:maltose O-acetyltransferase
LLCYHAAVKGFSDTLRRDAWLNTICASPLWSRRLRRRFLAWAGVQVAPSAAISPRCFFGGANVSIGANTSVNWGCFFDNKALVTIGNDCLIGMGVYFVTSHHEGASVVGRSIIVGDGCWIGARSVILPGVRIAPGCVVGAGSVVTRDLEPGKYAGNPARPITTSPSVVR